MFLKIETLAPLHGTLIAKRRGSVVLLVDRTEDDDSSGGLLEKEKDTNVKLLKDTAFIPNLVKILNRTNVDGSAMSGIVLTRQLANLIRHMLVLLFVQNAIAS